MPWQTEALNDAVGAAAGAITEASLHSSDPGTGGANEISGGDPAYARQTPSFAAASGGEAALSDHLDFSGPAAQAVSHIGYWKGATFYVSDTLSGDSAFNSEGEFRVRSGDTKLRVRLPSS